MYGTTIYFRNGKTKKSNKNDRKIFTTRCITVNKWSCCFGKNFFSGNYYFCELFVLRLGLFFLWILANLFFNYALSVYVCIQNRKIGQKCLKRLSKKVIFFEKNSIKISFVLVRICPFPTAFSIFASPIPIP